MSDAPDMNVDLGHEPWKPMKRLLIGLTTVVTLIGIVVSVGAFFLPVTRTRVPARRSQCKNNLKQICLALHNYVDDYGSLPPAYTTDENGNPLHSWRTLLLPYLDSQQLYSKIDLTKAWDDPANTAAYKTAINVYKCPECLAAAGFTTYLAVAGPNACIHPTRGRKLDEISDGTSNTAIVIEVASENAVHWMAPLDADEQLVLGFGPKAKQAHATGMHAAFADGSVKALGPEMPFAQRRALISINNKD